MAIDETYWGARATAAWPIAMFLLDKIFGRPLASSEEGKERLSIMTGIPVLGLDALASTGYGPETAHIAGLRVMLYQLRDKRTVVMNIPGYLRDTTEAPATLAITCWMYWRVPPTKPLAS